MRRDDDVPPRSTFAGPFLRLRGREWALANPLKPAWMNPAFHYGNPRDPVLPPPYVPPPVTCPRCGFSFGAAR